MYTDNDKGITLVEILIALCIWGLVVGSALALLQNSAIAYQRQSDEIYQRENVRETIWKISQYVMEGSTTEVYESLYKATSPTPTGSLLKIDNKFTIYLEGENIKVRNLTTNKESPLSTNVKSFTVTKPDVNKQSVKIQIVDKNNHFILDTLLTPRN